MNIKKQNLDSVIESYSKGIVHKEEATFIIKSLLEKHQPEGEYFELPGWWLNCSLAELDKVLTKMKEEL